MQNYFRGSSTWGEGVRIEGNTAVEKLGRGGVAFGGEDQSPYKFYVFYVLIQTCTPNGHLYRVTYTRCRIDTTDSPDDGHMTARNM